MIRKFNIIRFLPVFIALALFIVPFFWLKPGEMNLGGDSGRLFFYDPTSYLKVNSFYNIITSGTGEEANSYYTIPLVLVIIFLKKIFQSPTILIWLFNGMTLSVAYLACYGITRELLKQENVFKDSTIEITSVFAGLFYLFSPLSLNTGWETPILTHSQIFLNPLMFFLLLKYLKKRKLPLLLTAVFITVLFSINFTFISAPAFFAFYPVSILFLYLYNRFILKSIIHWKHIGIALLIFVTINLFHLGPQIIGIVSTSSSTQLFFSNAHGVDLRGGLDYFVSVAANIKKTYALFSLPQVLPTSTIVYFFILFPLTIFSSFLIKKRKTNYILGIFFLFIFFFTTAHVSEAGFTIYKSLFRIPGFSMFRNFYGQWLFTFLFFYTLLLGQCVPIVYEWLSRKINALYFVGMFALVFISGIGLITGEIVMHRDPVTKVRYAIRMDPIFEKVISFFRNDAVDGKVLSLPLTGPSYQVLQGKNGDAYQGLSLISYLAGKNDFNGYNSLKQFGDQSLIYLQNGNVAALEKILSILNIKYIFYNSDPYIYSKAFNNFAYSYVSKYAPKDQKSYKSLIDTFHINNIITFGDKYHIYSLSDSVFLPHIYTTNDAIYASNPLELTSSHLNYPSKQVMVNIGNINSENNIALIKAEGGSNLLSLKDNSQLAQHMPFVSIPLNSIKYPLILLREKLILWKFRSDRANTFNYRMEFASKRIYEIIKWGEELTIKPEPDSSFRIETLFHLKKYNNWVSSLNNYEGQMDSLIDWVYEAKSSDEELQINKIKIHEQLEQHKILLRSYINDHLDSSPYYNFLSVYINDMFQRLFGRLQLSDIDISILPYTITVPDKQTGLYELYVENNDQKVFKGNNTTIEINGKILKPITVNSENNYIQYENIFLDANKSYPLTLHLQNENLVHDSLWMNSGNVVNSGSDDNALINLPVSKQGGLMKEISEWKPNTQYLVSFEYFTNGDDIGLQIYDNLEEQKDASSVNQKHYVYSRRILNSTDWKTSQSIFTSVSTSKVGFINLFKEFGKSDGTIQIRNLRVQIVPDQIIMAKKIIQNTKSQSLAPLITFSKINPTKYVIKVHNAFNPYYLIFLDNYNDSWTLVNPEINSKDKYSMLWRMLGSLAVRSTGATGDINRLSVIKAEYFNGNVQEGISTNNFLDPYVFKSWGKASVADKRHMLAFDYANTWEIRPEDLAGRTDYILILEMKTQNNFYIFLFISFTVASISLGYLIISYFRKWR